MSDEADPNAMDAPCNQCGHPNGSHQLKANAVDPKLQMPTEGWRDCPEDGCECYATWALAPELLAGFHRVATPQARTDDYNHDVFGLNE